MTNPEPPANWSDQSWQPMPAPGSNAPATQPGLGLPAGTSPTTPYPTYDPTQGYPQGAYGAPYSAAGYGYGYGPTTQTTNGMAIGSMVVSIVSIAGLCAYGFGGLLGIVGAILGHVARRQIRDRGEGGDGMALAGIIVGWIATGLAAGIIALVVAFVWMAVNADPNALNADPNAVAPVPAR
jgi:hypothetical protein